MLRLYCNESLCTARATFAWTTMHKRKATPLGVGHAVKLTALGVGIRSTRICDRPKHGRGESTSRMDYVVMLLERSLADYEQRRRGTCKGEGPQDSQEKLDSRVDRWVCCACCNRKGEKEHGGSRQSSDQLGTPNFFTAVLVGRSQFKNGDGIQDSRAGRHRFAPMA